MTIPWIALCSGSGGPRRKGVLGHGLASGLGWFLTPKSLPEPSGPCPLPRLSRYPPSTDKSHETCLSAVGSLRLSLVARALAGIPRGWCKSSGSRNRWSFCGRRRREPQGPPDRVDDRSCRCHSSWDCATAVCTPSCDLPRHPSDRAITPLRRRRP